LGVILIAGSAAAQGSRLKSLSFKEGSTEFANTNTRYNKNTSKHEPLADTVIINQLLSILGSNPNLVIEVAGHCDSQEDSTIAKDRAEAIRALLISKGIAEERLVPASYGSSKPTIKSHVFDILETEEEIKAARQKNRRVTFEISRVNYTPTSD